MIRLRPLFAPALEWASILKGPWPLFEQCQVMQRIADILLMAVTAGMACNHLTLMQDINAEVTLTRFCGVSERGNSVRLLLIGDRTEVS